VRFTGQEWEELRGKTAGSIPGSGNAGVAEAYKYIRKITFTPRIRER
jgi:hypothetical protein